MLQRAYEGPKSLNRNNKGQSKQAINAEFKARNGTWLFQSLSSSYDSNPLNHRPDEHKQEAKSVNRPEIKMANMRTGAV